MTARPIGGMQMRGPAAARPPLYPHSLGAAIRGARQALEALERQMVAMAPGLSVDALTRLLNCELPELYGLAARVMGLADHAAADREAAAHDAIAALARRLMTTTTTGETS